MIALIMLPYAGSLGYTYRNLEPYLQDEFKVFSIDYRGRGRRSDLSEATNWHEEINDIVEHIYNIILKYDRYVLFGHSMGAYAVYEVYYSLVEKKCREPEYVVFSGVQVFNRFKPATFENEETFKKYYSDIGGIPEEILACPEFAEYIFDSIKQDIRLLNQFEYRPRYPMKCPIIVMNGLEESKSNVDEWSNFTKADCLYFTFPGGHFFINTSIDKVSEVLINECR